MSAWRLTLLAADGRWRDSVSVGGNGRNFTGKTIFFGGCRAVVEVSVSMRNYISNDFVMFSWSESAVRESRVRRFFPRYYV